MTIRAVIVEDEPLAIDRLRGCLAYADQVQVVGEARDGRVAVALLDALAPDLLFLDVQLPLLSGFEVLRGVAGGLVTGLSQDATQQGEIIGHLRSRAVFSRQTRVHEWSEAQRFEKGSFSRRES